jgi:hypothetical protein
LVILLGVGVDDELEVAALSGLLEMRAPPQAVRAPATNVLRLTEFFMGKVKVMNEWVSDYCKYTRL